MNEQEVSKLYNALLSKGYSTDDLGTAERFAEMMSSADNRKTLYDYVRSRGDFKIGNFDAYERRLAGQPLGEPQGAGGAATQSQHTEPQGAGVAATQSQHTEQPDTLSDEARSRMEEGARIGGGLTASMQAPQGAEVAATESPQTEPQGAGVAATQSQYTEQQGIDRSPEERMSVARTVAGARAVSGAVGAQQANAERYREGRRTSGQIRLGLGEERPSFFGSNPNVVASQQFNPQTGERETTYLTETGNEYTNKEGAVAEQNYHDAQHRLDKYQTELPVDINADAEERGRQLDAALEENSRRMRELSETRDTEERGFWQMLSDAISMSPTLGGSPTRQWSESDATRDQLKTLGAERDLLEQARRTNAVLRDLRKSDGFFDLNNVTNFVRGVKDEASDIRGMGLRDLFTATALKDIKDKMDRNEPLNDTELSLLAAAGVNSEIQTVAQGEMPHGYTAGVTTAAMAPFMAQLAMVPEGGLGGLFGRYATQMYGKAGLKSLAARAAAKISGDVLTSTILANTVQAPATYADALNRMTGDVTTDENGRVSFVGGESAGDSFRKAITAATIENYTEMAFEGNGGIGKQALTRLADRLGLQGVRNTLGRITRSQALDAVRRFESQVRWGGTIEEALEEELGIVLNSMFVGDNQLSDLVDADQQIDIILGVGVFGGAVSALKSGLYLRQQRNLSRAAEVASARGSVLFGDDRWAGIRARIDDADSDEALQSEISSLIQDPSLDNAQRRAVLEYGARRGAYQGYNYGMQIVRDEMSDTMRAGFDAFQVGMELSGSQLNDAGRTARNAKTFLNGTPDGQSIADAVDALIDAGTREEDVNAYFSSLSEGPSREAALDYFTSMMTLQGAAARMLEDAQAGISQFEADVDAGTATVNGEQAVIVATVDGQQAYVLDDNGSTALVMVDGEKRQVPSSAVENPTTFRPDAYKSQYRESVEQSINDELNFRFNNHANTEMPRVGLELHNGEDTYQIVDVNGATGAVTATRVKIDKNGQLVPDGGALVTLTTQDVLDMQNQYYEGLDARQAGGAATQSQHTEQGAGGAATESRQTGQDVVEAAEQEVLAVSPEGADYIDSIRQLIDSYGSVNESFYDGVPQNLVEPLRRYAEAYAVAAAGLQSTGADAVQAPPAGEPQGTVTDYPRDKDGDLDVDAIRQTGDSQMMSDALRSEFGDEQANAMAQQFLSEAVQVQGKEKNPVKRNGSRQKAVDFWRDVAGRLNTVPAAEPQGTMEKERPKNLSEEELSVYLHNENGELDYGRTNEILDDIDRGLARVGRFSPEEERGRYGKAATASAILQGGVNSRLERQRQDEARTGTPVTVADVLSPSQERDIDAENAEAFNRRYGELISYLKASGLWYNNLDEVLTLTDPSAEEMGRTESRVYLSKDGTSVIKILDLSEQLGGDPAVLSDFITLNNANFPDVALTLLGYMEEDGMLYAVMSQPRIRGTEADTYFKARGIDLDEGIAEALSRIGFTPVEGSKSTFQNDRYYMSDVHGGNIMIDEDGNVYPIDVKLELKDRAQAGDYGVRENRVPESHGTAGDAVRAKWEGAAKIEGNAGSKTLSGGQRIRGRYVLVEEGAATPSHDPSTFRPNEGFPVTESGQNANSRDYENDANAQASVQQMGGAYDGRAVDDTPVVSSEGVVWSGNNRVMSGQLAAQNGTDAGYKEALMDNAAMYGFTPEQVDGMAHPRVYFVPDAGQGLDYTPQTFNLFNAPQQKEEGSVGKGVKMGKVLTDRTFGLMSQIVSDYGSLANIFKSANACRDLVRIMQEAEEIVKVNQQTLPRYLTPDGLLTEDGQNLVNAALVGYMFRDNAEVLGYLERLPKSAIRQMADAMPELVANARMGEYALGAELAEAIKALYQQSESGQSMEDFMRQYDLFAEGGTLYGETTKALIEAMSGRVANATNGTLKDLMSQYNERAADAASGQGDMFSRNSREDILRDVLGLVPAEAATLSQQTEPQEAGASGEENSQNTSEQTNNSLSLQPENERNDGPGKVEDSDGGGDGVDGAHAAASRLLRGISIEPVSERQESGSKERLLAEVEKSARDSGQWFEGIASQLDGYQLSSGGENEVYLANGEITKLNNFAFLRDDATNFEDFLNRIESFNDLFPDVALRLLGFAKNSKGEVCVVMSQPAITNSREATEEEIDAALEDMGFYTDISGEWTDGRYVISDLKPNNVLVDSEGHLHFIDVVTFDDTKPGRMMVPRKPEAEEDAATESQQTESRGTEGVRFSVVEPIADFDTRKISEAKTNAEWAEAVTESDNVARAKRRVAPIVEKVAQEYRGISRVIISTGKSFLEELAKDERLSDEDRNDLLAVANGEIEAPNAGYIASIDKIIIFNLGASESEIKSYLCHEIAHRAIRHLALSGRMSDWAEVLERLNPTLAKYVREAYARYGRDAQIPEEVVVHIIEHLVRDYGVEGTRSRLQNLEANNGEKAKGLTSIIDFIEHGRQRENQQAERENRSREGSTEGNAVERDVRARGERYSLLGSEPGSREEEGVAFSLGGNPLTQSAMQRAYNEKVRSARLLARETLVDYLSSVKVLQDIVAKQKRNGKIPDYENVYWRLIQLSSRNKSEMDRFEGVLVAPLNAAISGLVRKGETLNWDDKSGEELSHYVMSKHGIERNRDMAVRASVGDDASRLEDWYQKVDSVRNGKGDWESKQRKLDDIAQNDFKADLSKDYSGLSSMYKSSPDFYEAAYGAVKDYEKNHPSDAVDELWTAIQAISGYSLAKQEQSGLVDSDYLTAQNRRFEYFVPLRGFEEDTSEDVFSYIMSQRDEMGNPVRTAHGRTSVAGNPFSNLLNVAYRSIVSGNRNQALQALANLARLNDTQGLLTVDTPWVENIGTQENPVWQEASPDIPDDLTDPDAISRLLSDFERDMQKKREAGLAKKSAPQGKNFPYRVVKSLGQHQVRVLIGGRSYIGTVGGDPRAALALKGALASDTDMSALARLNRFMSAAFTAYNLPFSSANLYRDAIHANMRAFITEDPQYWARFTARQAAFGLTGTNSWVEGLGAVAENAAFGAPFLAKTAKNWIRMMGLLSWYRKETGNNVRSKKLNEMVSGVAGGAVSAVTLQRFKDFMDAGGATGYTFVRSQEDDLSRMVDIVKSLSGGKRFKALRDAPMQLLDLIQFCGETSELTNRFIAYETSLDMGRSKTRAIADAKEITLNFNRKGAGRKTYDPKRSKREKKWWERKKYELINGLSRVSQYGQNHIIFWNANIQGKYQMYEMAKTHPLKFGVAEGALMAFAGLGVILLNDVLLPGLYEAFGAGGDDDDKMTPYFDALSDWERTSNICVRLPNGGWAKIPLNPDMRPLYAMADAIGGGMSGAREFDYVNDVLLNIAEASVPVTIAQDAPQATAVNFMPSWTQPIGRVVTNSNFYGKALRREGPYNKYDPQWRKTYRGTSPTMTEASRLIGHALGGSDQAADGNSNTIIIHPTTLKSFIEGYTGGYGSSSIFIADWIYSQFGHDGQKIEIDVHDIPVANRFYVSGGSGQTNRRKAQLFYETVANFYEKEQTRIRNFERDVADAGVKSDTLKFAEIRAAYDDYLLSEDYQKFATLYSGKHVDYVKAELKGHDYEDLPEKDVELMDQLVDFVRHGGNVLDEAPGVTPDKRDKRRKDLEDKVNAHRNKTLDEYSLDARLEQALEKAKLDFDDARVKNIREFIDNIRKFRKSIATGGTESERVEENYENYVTNVTKQLDDWESTSE